MRRDVQGGVIVSFYLTAAFLFKRATRRIADQSRIEPLTARAAALDARFQALQARTNPHFLFNTLNSIMSLIGKDPRPGRAGGRTARDPDALRDWKGRPIARIACGRSWTAVRDYLAIEQVRFGERLAVEVLGGRRRR